MPCPALLEPQALAATFAAQVEFEGLVEPQLVARTTHQGLQMMPAPDMVSWGMEQGRMALAEASLVQEEVVRSELVSQLQELA